MNLFIFLSATSDKLMKMGDPYGDLSFPTNFVIWSFLFLVDCCKRTVQSITNQDAPDIDCMMARPRQYSGHGHGQSTDNQGYSRVFALQRHSCYFWTKGRVPTSWWHSSPICLTI
uniref:Uncharacterized protein n=1 Tax=Spongospora subterranea TaxID=70186 RepID=A0A0H5QXM4_9EUKA|eukprot:CRZ06492.1 hypothetical protein [Spongospora subterranea]